MPLVGEVDANPTNSGQHPRRDESIWACHIEPAFGVIPLAKIRRSDVAAWVVDLSEDLAPSTVTRCLVVIKKCFSDAVAEALIAASPALSVKPPRPDQIERRFLTLGELNRIEAAMVKRWRIVAPAPPALDCG